MPPSNTRPNEPRTLDDLIPLLGDAVEHAQTLQGAAQVAVDGVNGAATTVNNAVANLEKAKAALSGEIASNVRRQVVEALEQSATTMGQTLAHAETTAVAALDQVSQASASASSALLRAARDVESKKLLYMVVGFVAGLVVGGAAVGGFMAYNDLHELVARIVRQ